MRATLLRKQGANITTDNSAMQESQLQREVSLGHNQPGDSLFDMSAIAPNATIIHGMNANVR